MGGSAGLGLMLAREWGLCGARVIIVARNRHRLDQAAESLREEEIDVMTYAADITEWGQVTEMRRWFDQEYESLHVLVNAAGRSDRGLAAEVPVETFESLMRLNFLATAHCCHTFLGPLLKTHGSVVNIGSLASKVATPYLGAYPPSKFAVAAYSQQLRLENPGVHVLLVCPGPIRRDDAGSRYEEEARHLPPAARQPGGGAHSTPSRQTTLPVAFSVPASDDSRSWSSLRGHDCCLPLRNWHRLGAIGCCVN